MAGGHDGLPYWRDGKDLRSRRIGADFAIHGGTPMNYRLEKERET